MVRQKPDGDDNHVPAKLAEVLVDVSALDVDPADSSDDAAGLRDQRKRCESQSFIASGGRCGSPGGMVKS